MLYTTLLVYLEYIKVYGRNVIEMLGRFDTALERLGQANFKLNASKCGFGRTLVNFVGDVISDKGISTDSEKLLRIK